MIPFNQTAYDERDARAVLKALTGGTDFRPQARAMLTARFPRRKVFLTASGSAAFELLFAGLALPPGGEVIMPSFTFPSCASAAMRAGLCPVFAEIGADTLTLDIDDTARRTTARTRCVAVTHYGGSSPDMEALTHRCRGLFVVEDAALSIGARHRGSPLGGIADVGILSFHETKNISAGEGGALLVDQRHGALIDRLQMIYDNGTDREAFLNGKVSGYTWQTPGMNVAMPNLCAALLCAQLEKEDEITRKHRQVCDRYREALTGDAARHGFTLPRIPPENEDNGHVFYLLCADHAQRERLRGHLGRRGISAQFHYMPLHASAMGAKLGYRSWRPARDTTRGRMPAAAAGIRGYDGSRVRGGGIRPAGGAMNPDSLCVVVPVYNARNTITPLVERLQEVLGGFASSQIVLVDDGSRDGSAGTLRGLYERYKNITVVLLRRNYGQQSALLCGLRQCRCDYAVIIDDDLEQDPCDIPALYGAIRRGYDVVYGVGAQEKGAFRSWGSRLRDRLFDRITDKPPGVRVCSFRIMNRATVDHVVKADTRFVYISLEILKYTNRIGNIPVRTGERVPSGYRPLQLMGLLLRMYVYYAPWGWLRLLRRRRACYEIGEILHREDGK